MANYMTDGGDFVLNVLTDLCLKTLG